MSSSANLVPRTHAASIENPLPPAWVAALLGGAAARRTLVHTPAGRLDVREFGGLALLRVCVDGACALDDEAFERMAEEVYRTLLQEIDRRRLFALRFWNYLPDIGRAAQKGFTRYELFNAGRFAAYAGDGETGPRAERLRPATAVGHRGDDLEVHVLAGRVPGLPFENPRQRPAYRYSQRYGPCPPSFARALRLDGAWADAAVTDGSDPLAIVAGTASIVGEDSQHRGDVLSQLDEICANLSALAECAFAGDASGAVRSTEGEDPLTLYRELRVYLVDAAQAERVRPILLSRFRGLDTLEIVSADLCRKELLIEIEAVLGLGGRLHVGKASGAGAPSLRAEV